MPCGGTADSSVLEDPNVPRQLFLVNVSLAWSAENEALVSLAYDIFFASPMCYKIQAQGGSSSSVCSAGATNIFFS